MRQPNKLRVGPNNKPLHEAKLLNIRGVGLSLQDIRENIVYANWESPDVCTVFSVVILGALPCKTMLSPAVMLMDLKIQASEFVNSLRGVHDSQRSLKVSSLYEEARDFYFQIGQVI